MSYSIVKELTGDVSIIDYTTGVIVKTHILIILENKTNLTKIHT